MDEIATCRWRSRRRSRLREERHYESWAARTPPSHIRFIPATKTPISIACCESAAFVRTALSSERRYGCIFPHSGSGRPTSARWRRGFSDQARQHYNSCARAGFFRQRQARRSTAMPGPATSGSCSMWLKRSVLLAQQEEISATDLQLAKTCMPRSGRR